MCALCANSFRFIKDCYSIRRILKTSRCKLVESRDEYKSHVLTFHLARRHLSLRHPKTSLLWMCALMSGALISSLFSFVARRLEHTHIRQSGQGSLGVAPIKVQLLLKSCAPRWYRARLFCFLHYKHILLCNAGTNSLPHVTQHRLIKKQTSSTHLDIVKQQVRSYWTPPREP